MGAGGKFLSDTWDWNEPNDDWSIIAPTGGQKVYMTNIRRDDTDHDTDLWLYTTMLRREKEQTHDDMLPQFIEQNRTSLDRERKWYLRQFDKKHDRVGIKRFTGLPLDAFMHMWRQPLETARFHRMEVLANTQTFIAYENPVDDSLMRFKVYLDWAEFQHDKEDKVGKWVRKHVRRFSPFSDGPMFLRPEDEICYSIDCVGL